MSLQNLSDDLLLAGRGDDAGMIDVLDAFVTLVADMREQQSIFFRAERNSAEKHEAMVRARELERAVDKQIARLRAHNETPSLFEVSAEVLDASPGGPTLHSKIRARLGREPRSPFDHSDAGPWDGFGERPRP